MHNTFNLLEVSSQDIEISDYLLHYIIIDIFVKIEKFHFVPRLISFILLESVDIHRQEFVSEENELGCC